MSDDGKKVRVNVFITLEAAQMLDELGKRLYPTVARPDGAVVDTAIRQLYEREKLKGAKHA